MRTESIILEQTTGRCEEERWLFIYLFFGGGGVSGAAFIHTTVLLIGLHRGFPTQSIQHYRKHVRHIKCCKETKDKGFGKYCRH